MAARLFEFQTWVSTVLGLLLLMLEAKPALAKEPLIPTYAGGQMPLSTFLADGVRHLLEDHHEWGVFDSDVRGWLELQEKFSVMPGVSVSLSNLSRAGRCITAYIIPSKAAARTKHSACCFRGGWSGSACCRSPSP